MGRCTDRQSYSFSRKNYGGTLVPGLLLMALLSISLMINILRYSTFGSKKTFIVPDRQALTGPSVIWDIPALDNVYMRVENTVHYAIGTELGVVEWKSLLPLGNGTIYLKASDNTRQEFTASIFHQLRCLDIIREGIISFRGGANAEAHRSSPSPLVQHCMDYMRQMVLCRSTTQLQSVRNHTGTRITVSDVTQVCKDWTTILREAEINYAKYGPV